MPNANNSNINISGGKYSFARVVQPGQTTNLVNEYTGEGASYNIWTEDWLAWRDPAQNPCSSSSGGDSGSRNPPPPDGRDMSIIAPGDPIGTRCHLYGGNVNGD
jgi:hypothetical protein